MNPHDFPDLYDAIVLAGVRSPGVVSISGLKRTEKWDVKDGDGQDGASTTRKGRTPAQFTCRFSLVVNPGLDVDEMADWEAFLPVLRSTSESSSAGALDVYHPDLAEVGVASVVVQSIGARQHDGKGGCVVDVEFLEYAAPKPKPAKGTAKSSSGGANGASDVDPNDPLTKAEAELDALAGVAEEI